MKLARLLNRLSVPRGPRSRFPKRISVVIRDPVVGGTLGIVHVSGAFVELESVTCGCIRASNDESRSAAGFTPIRTAL